MLVSINLIKAKPVHVVQILLQAPF